MPSPKTHFATSSTTSTVPKHSRLRRVSADIAHHALELGFDYVERDPVNGLHPDGVLRSQRHEHRGPVRPRGGECLQIGLDARIRRPNRTSRS